MRDSARRVGLDCHRTSSDMCGPHHGLGHRDGSVAARSVPPAQHRQRSEHGEQQGQARLLHGALWTGGAEPAARYTTMVSLASTSAATLLARLRLNSRKVSVGASCSRVATKRRMFGYGPLSAQRSSTLLGTSSVAALNR